MCVWLCGWLGGWGGGGGEGVISYEQSKHCFYCQSRHISDRYVKHACFNFINVNNPKIQHSCIHAMGVQWILYASIFILLVYINCWANKNEMRIGNSYV